MRAYPFDFKAGTIHVRVRILGPAGEGIFLFALDTGASRSLLCWEGALQLGYSPEKVSERVEIVTGSGTEFCPVLPIDRIGALGKELEGFPILCHTLPPKAQLQGLLGLDFLAGAVLTVDLRRGLLRLA